MACPRCKAPTRYVLNEERTEILGTECSACEWREGRGFDAPRAGQMLVARHHVKNGPHFGVIRTAIRFGETWTTVLHVHDLWAEYGGMTVTNGAEHVVRKLREVEGGLVDVRIIYRDTEGNWDELRHDGAQFIGFGGLDARSSEEAFAALQELSCEACGAPMSLGEDDCPRCGLGGQA